MPIIPKIEPLIDERLYQALRAKRAEMADRAVAYVFLPVSELKPDLLFIGQATSGMVYDHEVGFPDALKASGEMLCEGMELIGSMKKTRSRFWITAKKIRNQVTRIVRGDDKPPVAVGWPNLAKIGASEGNPDRLMLDAQRELCANALQQELRTARPVATILLTGNFGEKEILFPAFGEDGWRSSVRDMDRVAVKHHPELGLLLWGYHSRDPWSMQHEAELNAFIAGYAAMAIRSREEGQR